MLVEVRFARARTGERTAPGSDEATAEVGLGLEEEASRRSAFDDPSSGEKARHSASRERVAPVVRDEEDGPGPRLTSEQRDDVDRCLVVESARRLVGEEDERVAGGRTDDGEHPLHRLWKRDHLGLEHVGERGESAVQQERARLQAAPERSQLAQLLKEGSLRQADESAATTAARATR